MAANRSAYDSQQRNLRVQLGSRARDPLVLYSHKFVASRPSSDHWQHPSSCVHSFCVVVSLVLLWRRVSTVYINSQTVSVYAIVLQAAAGYIRIGLHHLAPAPPNSITPGLYQTTQPTFSPRRKTLTLSYPPEVSGKK